jgi:Zn-dependent protease with chaperone function
MALAFAALGFVVTNVLLSFVVIALWRVVRISPRRSLTLFLLRMLPAAGSTALVIGVILPAFLVFEPEGTNESGGFALAVFAVLAAGVIGAGLYRGVARWRTTRRLERAWTAVALGETPSGVAAPAYRIRCDSAFAVAVGVFRPRLYVSDRFLHALSEGERRTVFAHEAGHLVSFDNLKRTLMACAPDGLSLVRIGREIETAWRVAAEDEADDHAAGADRAGALDLASALIKALRLAPGTCGPAMSFCGEASVARRVSRLLSDDPPAAPRASRLRHALWGALAVVGLAALAGPALRASYVITESALTQLR